MELGGKNALLVLPDAPLWRAVPGAVQGITSNGGQLCISIERVYVHDAIYDAFVPRLAERLKALRLGPSLTYADDMGSLTSAGQLAKVSAHVDDAVGKGAEVLAGGRARPDLGPYFYEPTLLAGVTEDMELCHAETFGPVAAVHRCSSVDEMVERANDSEYGLNASVWTRDVKAGREVAARIEAGTVNVNEAYAAAWASAAPMGGWKQSGLGRRHGRHGLVKYTSSQTVAAEHVLNIGTPPFLNNGQYAAVMTQAVRLLKRVPGIK
jgi:succinate-semialdehyde dehydrogenase/glutarate-semialdehyde dehydrogenase